MQYEKYGHVIASSDKLEFQFDSEGPKGKVEMVVQFTQTNNTDIYNLAFGVLKKDGTIDDLTTNDNKDRNKILATVAATVYEFTAYYSDKTVFFCGSTPERSRLYRMALSLNLSELEKDFLIYGILKGIDSYEKMIFKKGVDYFSFMIKRKKSNFIK
jgi:hypothetical protein